jgi:transcriptional regulator with XRE-family HTH domain
MPRHNAFSQALRAVRRQRGLTQEALDEQSSRTYVSMLERGMQSPTLAKVDQLAEMMDVHPLTLLILSYAASTKQADIDRVLAVATHELKAICSPPPPKKGS